MKYVPYVNREFTERIGTVESPYIIHTEEGQEPKWIPVRPETVGQYTGQKDKNGREIYEGDIVEFEDGTRLAVRWDERNCFYALVDEDDNVIEDFFDIEPSDYEVIGNIHDDPELLKNE